MSISVHPALNSPELPPAPARRFTVDEYHRMIETGFFGPEERVELLNGWIVNMSPHSPPHDTCIHLTESAIEQCLPRGWIVRVQSSITLSESEPEPDIAVVMGHARQYSQQHPVPRNVGLLVEVSQSSLEYDRKEKGPTYARAGIPAYWIVNLPDSKVETYSAPDAAGYQQRRDYESDESVPLVLDGQEVGRIAVRDFLP